MRIWRPPNIEELLTAAIDMVDFLIEQTPTTSGGMIRIVRRTPGDMPQVSVLSNQLKHVDRKSAAQRTRCDGDGGDSTIETRNCPRRSKSIVSTKAPESRKI